MKDFNAINRVMGNVADGEHKPMRISMQFFADGGGNGDGADDNTGDDGDDDQDDDDQDDKGSGDKGKKSDKKKYFTQEELDEAIKKRLERERKKAEKEKAAAEADKNKTAEQKAKEQAEKTAKEQVNEVNFMSQKLVCYDNDVPKANINKVIKLANVYVDDDTDFEEAILKVKEDFPFLFKESKSEDDEEDNNKAWGQRQTGKTTKIDPVEARFLEKNPGLKID